MDFANFPHAIASFLEAAGRRDTPAVRAVFSDAAVLVDGGIEYRGDAIQEWSELLFLQSGAVIRPINAARREGKTVLTAMVAALDDGSGARTPVQLDWCFTVADGKILSLTISAAKSLDLPAPVASYVSAANSFDLEALLAAFADDAVVNDQLREYRGKKAIRGWAARDIIGDRVTMYVVEVVQHHGHVIVTANVDGDYDKRGLPDPLVVTFYFSIDDGKISQLIILRNEQDV
jgi:SnoaL-like domain